MKNQIVRAKCVDMSVDGKGIAKSNDYVIFVKDMIVGEEADIKIISEKKNYAYGIIDKMIVPSKNRVIPDCKISYKCGGCDYRYIEYNYQLKLKKAVLDNTFKNYHVLDIIPDNDPYYYRNKVQVPVKDHKLGFYRKYSNDIVEFDDCKIESKIANKIIDDLKKLLINTSIEKCFRHIIIKHGFGTDEIMVCFVVTTFNLNIDDIVSFLINKYSDIKSIMLNLNDKDTNVILGNDEKILYGRDYIYDTCEDIKIKYSLKSFYQVNHCQMIKLYNVVKDYCDLSFNDEVLDLYCGVGTISLFVARHCKKVTGVEIVKEAIENAIENAKLNDINNANFILADANNNMDEFLINKDIVILDPPRKGVSKNLIDSIIKSNINKVIYVSCNPATLARDLELFKDYYDVSDIQPVDMFPFTTHVECCLRLTRR